MQLDSQTDLPDNGMIGIVVVNYGSHRLIERNLPADLASRANARVVIVDNFSDAAELSAIRTLSADRGWDLVELPSNDGFGVGANAGALTARRLGCRSLLFLNPDAIVTAEVVAALHQGLQADPMTMLSPRIVDSAGGPYFSGSQLDLRQGRLGRSLDGPSEALRPWLSGACLAVHDTLFTLVGGFDPDYFLYWEDVDLSLRVTRAGGRLAVRDDQVVVHDEGGTQSPSDSRAKTQTYYYYNCRNRMLFASKHLSRSAQVRWMLSTPKASWQILLRGGRRQLLASPRPLWAALTGSTSGILSGLKSLLRRTPRDPSPVYASQPPRRLLIAHPSADLYGSDRVVLESLDAMVAAGWQVTVTMPSGGPLVEQIKARGGSVVLCRTPVVRKSALRPRGFLALLADGAFGLLPAARLIRTAGADGIYVNTITVPAWLVLGRILGKPVLSHVHEAEGSASRAVRRIISFPVRFAHRVVINSKFSLGVLQDAAPSVPARARVVYNGVPGPPVVERARVSLDGPVELLFIGRLSPRKGPQVALAALAELVRQGQDVRLRLLGAVFPGYEWFEQELRQTVVNEALAERVDFLGFESDIWPRVGECDIVIVPSVVDEPFGNTAVEAILAARPLVVSATSGLLEAAAGYDSAQAVPPDDPHALAQAIRTVIDEWNSYREMAWHDSTVASTRHSVEVYREQIREIVTDVSGRGR